MSLSIWTLKLVIHLTIALNVALHGAKPILPMTDSRTAGSIADPFIQ